MKQSHSFQINTEFVIISHTAFRCFWRSSRSGIKPKISLSPSLSPVSQIDMHCNAEEREGQSFYWSCCLAMNRNNVANINNMLANNPSWVLSATTFAVEVCTQLSLPFIQLCSHFCFHMLSLCIFQTLWNFHQDWRQ
jgi:hypothetical protein